MTDKKRGRLYAVLLAAVIILQCIALVYIFAVKKTSFHEDEVFSYALSNSYKRPFIYGSAHQVVDNYDVWFTGTEFRDYIRTNEDTRFRYDSVWYNQAEDVHPPLYYAILHTICSVNTGKFSWWYAFAINLVCFVLTQVFLYLLSDKVMCSKLRALLVCAFWGATLAAQNNYLFLRMYGMNTLFSVIYAYLCIGLAAGGKPDRKRCVLIALTAFLGAMTQHFFLVYAFFVTAFVCIWLLIRKEFKHFFGVGAAAASGVALSFLVFPATISHMMPGAMIQSEEPNRRNQMIRIGSQLGRGLFGIEWLNTDLFLFSFVALCVIIPLMIPLLFLFRKEPWMLRFRAYLKKRIKEMPERAGKIRSTIPPAVLIIIICAVFYVVVSGLYCYNDFGEDSERYYYQITPLIVLAFIWLALTIISIIPFRKARIAMHSALVISLAAAIVYQHCTYKMTFVISSDTEKGYIKEYTANSDCILLSASPIYLPIYTFMLEEADDIYFTCYGDARYIDDDLLAEYQKLFNQDEPFILILDEANFCKPEDEYSEDLLVKARYRKEKTEEFALEWFSEKSGRNPERLTAETAQVNRVVAFRFDPQT